MFLVPEAFDMSGEYLSSGKILKSKIFDNIWIQPAAGDAGGSLGAALALWHLEQKNKRKDRNKRRSQSDNNSTKRV